MKRLKSSDLKGIGSAGRGQNRTSWDFSLVLGIPSSRWGAIPFVCSPIPFPKDIILKVDQKNKQQNEPKKQNPRSFELAFQWRQQLENDPMLSRAKIAAREGISRARVTQVMNLLQLPAEIQEVFQGQPNPLEIQSFCERKLRQILASKDPESQLCRWRALVQER